MAAITATTVPRGFHVIRQASAQATTGQTDWLRLPTSTHFVRIFLNVTAVAGTTRSNTVANNAPTLMRSTACFTGSEMWSSVTSRFR